MSTVIYYFSGTGNSFLGLVIERASKIVINGFIVSIGHSRLKVRKVITFYSRNVKLIKKEVIYVKK